MLAEKSVIENVRKRFLVNYEENQILYHENDVRNIRENDWPIERFVVTNKTEDTALNALIKAMKWRKSFGVNDFYDQYFPLEIYKMREFFSFGKDKEGRPILWYIGKNHYKSAELGLLVRQFTAYQMDKLDREGSHQGWVMIGDSTDSGLSNVDMDFSNFIVELLQTYFPRSIMYLAVVDLPWILNATSKLIMAFMNEELRNSVKFMKKEELTSNFVDTAVVPTHLGGSNESQMHAIPDGVKPIKEMPHLGFTPKQIEKIYSTFKSTLK